MNTQSLTLPSIHSSGTLLRWLKRFGVAGFTFFLIKGLLWLIVPALVYFYS